MTPYKRKKNRLLQTKKRRTKILKQLLEDPLNFNKLRRLAYYNVKIQAMKIKLSQENKHREHSWLKRND